VKTFRKRAQKNIVYNFVCPSPLPRVFLSRHDICFVEGIKIKIKQLNAFYIVTIIFTFSQILVNRNTRIVKKLCLYAFFVKNVITNKKNTRFRFQKRNGASLLACTKSCCYKLFVNFTDDLSAAIA